MALLTSECAPTTLRRLDELVRRFHYHRATLAAVAALDAELTHAEIEEKPSTAEGTDHD